MEALNYSDAHLSGHYYIFGPGGLSNTEVRGTVHRNRYTSSIGVFGLCWSIAK
jgi:hypothetical protein